MQFQGAINLPCCPTHERHDRTSVARRTHRNGQPLIGTYQHKNHADIRKNHRLEDKPRHGNIVAQAGRYEKEYLPSHLITLKQSSNERTRRRLKSYQDTYAVAMAKYGLQRGIDGSEARHKSTQQYYRDIQKLADDLKAEVVDLQQQKDTAQEELRRAKKEIQIEKLKEAATTAADNIAESVVSFFGSNKAKALKKENTTLHREIATHEGTIEILQNKIQTMQAEHSRQMLDIQQQYRKEMERQESKHRKEVSRLTRLVEKICTWFPLAKEILRFEKLCLA